MIELGLQAVERVEHATSNLDKAQEIIRDTFFAHRFRALARPRTFTFRHTSSATGDLAIDTLLHTGSTAESIDPIDYTIVAVVRQGEVRFATADEELVVGRGDAVLYPQGVPFTADWHSVDVLLTRLPTREVARVAATRAGLDPADLRFDSMRPVSAGGTQQWRRTMTYLHRLFDPPDAVIEHPLVRTGAVDLAASAVLAVFPNSAYRAAYVPGAGAVAPAAVRRAIAYMEAHAGEPITLADVADAARIGHRGLQQAFRRHLGRTPTAHLRRIRLDRAHQALAAADPSRGVTVAEIARRWGFANLSRFAADYREIHGRTPSRTLRT